MTSLVVVYWPGVNTFFARGVRDRQRLFTDDLIENAPGDYCPADIRLDSDRNSYRAGFYSGWDFLDEDMREFLDDDMRG